MIHKKFSSKVKVIKTKVCTHCAGTGIKHIFSSSENKYINVPCTNCKEGFIRKRK